MSRISNVDRSRHFALCSSAMVCSFALAVLSVSPTIAAILTTGNVTPDPNTTTSSTTFYVGNIANGSMTVDNGSTVSSGFSNMGYTAGVTGIATITGNGSKWTASSLDIGR